MDNSEIISPKTGTMAAIAHRPKAGDPMADVRECTVVVGRGLSTENRPTGKREVTLISLEAWAEACRELGWVVSWHARRANLLVEGFDLAACIGKVISVGPVLLRIHGETAPCGIMDEQHTGLTKALAPSCRGGVYAEVIEGGKVAVGDPVAFANAQGPA